MAELGQAGAGGGMFQRLFDVGLDLGGQYATKELNLAQPNMQAARLGVNQTITAQAVPTPDTSLWNEKTALILGGAVFVVFFIIMASK